MKYLGILILFSFLIRCAPSVIKRNFDHTLNVRYEIIKNENSQIKASTIKLADSLTIKALKKKNNQQVSIKDLYLRIHVDDLKWFCPDRKRIEAEGFAAGFTGGIIGASIWGTKNFATVYGISNIRFQIINSLDSLDIKCTDTITFEENYMKYSSSKTKKRAITEAFNKSLECMFSKSGHKNEDNQGNPF